MSSRFQQAETEGTAPLGAVIPKRPVPEASWVRRKAIINGRKSRRTFSDLFLSLPKETASTPFVSVSGLARFVSADPAARRLHKCRRENT